MEFLSTQFVMDYVKNTPKPLTELGEFVYYRTYSRWLPGRGRREYWHETVKRAIEYSIALEYKHRRDEGLKINLKALKEEAQELFANIYETKQFPSGRTLWIGNANEKVNRDFTSGNFNCFTRETEFITDKGIRSFMDYEDGDNVSVLDKEGKWATASVRKFGSEEIYELQVRKGKRVETIRTTANHRWYAKNTASYSTFDVRTTADLKPGNVLRGKKRYEQANIVPSSIGIMHGMVFGDGTYDKNKNHCRIHLVGEKQELLKHFTDGSVCTAGKADQTVVYGLPNTWKQLPSMDMNIEYLYGFLMGLFATDGSVSNNQHTISSVSRDTLRRVQDIALVCGINVGNIRTVREESPYTQEYRPLYQVGLSNLDIKDGFHLRDKHKNNYTGVNVEKRSERVHWKVESVKPTGVREDVWCVQEPETESFTLANGILTKNCSFLNITKMEDLGDLFYLLLVGTGVGFKHTRKLSKKLPKINTQVEFVHKPYDEKAPEDRLEHTTVTEQDGTAIIEIGDSKEGWTESLRHLLGILSDKKKKHIKQVRFIYDSVRPRGERLKTFGGTASGPEPLKDMFDGISKVLNNQIDPNLDPIDTDEDGFGKLRPIHILDIGNLIGAGVVIGGVRRTAEIFLCDADDWEVILAKYGINGIWDDVDPKTKKVIKSAEEKHGEVISALEAVLGEAPEWFVNLPLNVENPRDINHRRMSNNSIAFEKKPSREMLHLMFVIMQNEGEPGFVNLEEAKRRKTTAQGLNPCVEIILDSYGVCNLTTINVTQFIRKDEFNSGYHLDLGALMRAQELSARIGLRMTLVTLEMPHWDKVQKRDRLVGTSLTGWQDAMDICGYSIEQETQIMRMLKQTSRNAADAYAKDLRIAAPELATTVKPEGTLSQVAKNPITNSPVSNGLHVSHSPFFIRRVRINANDPLAMVAKEQGWVIHAEVGTNGCFSPEKLIKPEQLEAARTWVIDFPVASGANKTKDDVDVNDQFDTYFNFQKNYTEHNSSNTIHVKPHEWGVAEQRVWDGWDDFVGVSFLSHDGGTYTLAPYETITEEEYHERKGKMKLFDPGILHKYEESETEADMENMDSCSQGVCPIR